MSALLKYVKFKGGSRDERRAQLAIMTLNEAASSLESWPPYHSPHEAYGVLAEEVAEFFDLVRAKDYDREAARKELIQIAAVAIRAAEEL